MPQKAARLKEPSPGDVRCGDLEFGVLCRCLLSEVYLQALAAPGNGEGTCIGGQNQSSALLLICCSWIALHAVQT